MAAQPCPEPSFNSHHLLQTVYTSGTESLPKGAMLTHGAVIDQYVSCIIEGEMAEGGVVLHALSVCHCAQLDVFLGPSVYLGSTSIITAKPKPEGLKTPKGVVFVDSLPKNPSGKLHKRELRLRFVQRYAEP